MDLHSLKENARHGTVSFPLAFYEWAGRESWQIPLHWHDETELIFFEHGDFQAWLNTKEFQIKAPAIMCVHAGELHSLLLPEHALESAVVFNLNILSFEHYDSVQAKLIRPLIEGRMKMPLLLEPSASVFSRIKDRYLTIAEKIQKMNRCSPSREFEKNALYLQIKATLYNLLATLYQENFLQCSGNFDPKSERQIENLKKVLSYIQEHYAAPIKLEDLASLVNLNPQYFCRYFKENIGKTATRYIQEVRMEKAAEALAETNEKIITIAADSGFDNIGYFIRKFREIKGVTPSEYRKKSK